MTNLYLIQGPDGAFYHLGELLGQTTAKAAKGLY